MRDEFLWVEKYRPKTIEDCILPENIKKTFSDFLSKGEVIYDKSYSKKIGLFAWNCQKHDYIPPSFNSLT